MSTSPARPDFQGVRLAYDTVARDYATRMPDTHAEAPLDLAMVDAFAEAVRVGSGDDPLVLDAGCGAGRMGRYLADQGCQVVGLDLSPGMITMARRDHRDLLFAVGSLADLPFPGSRFAGVLLWYSTIHTPPAGQGRVFAEAARVLRPGGHLLVGFQAGHGTRDVAATYRRFGHEIVLERHLVTADRVAAWIEAAGLREVCRLVRRARGAERDDQAVMLATVR
ncbi:methyltransferase family protein [Micromonospora sp. Llam0]|uniref:class I SAM-dependent methyltransferase n=1 Tax=Micromonospora sp. Llam0 TaxID=2485143 RepID=UPI000F99D906|nr:class I SAM-dependent methyltransferase [Micromonospora sp. Llam0]ROO58930.1 methyltransferase family protein [Micromonospora sp. Llam0]